MRYDAIIVGARCAGSTTAMLLARKGYRVLVVDRARFPSDTMCTHWVHLPGMARLREWGLLDAVRDSNCPAVITMHFTLGPVSLHGSPVPAGDLTTAYAPRRIVLDDIVLTAAAAAGAEVREGFSVQDLLRDEDGTVIGIRGGPRSATVEHARIVIGADGMHSLVARTVQAPMYDHRPALECAYYAHWSGLPTDGVEAHHHPGTVFVLIPTNDELTLLLMGYPHHRFHEFRADIEGSMLNTIAQFAPELRERLAAAQREDRFVGTADLPNFYRRPYGPGWALVGDAGYHKDPCTAQGLSDAFRDAELLAQALDDGWSNRADLTQALAGYESTRNAASHQMYEFTCQLATLEAPPPPIQEMFAALQTDPVGTSKFLGVFVGTVSPADFFGAQTA
ncbi:MAG: NAD(P)/FAD-dependent oxidoreductase [Pseudonocardiaceae bacterium]